MRVGVCAVCGDSVRQIVWGDPPRCVGHLRVPAPRLAPAPFAYPPDVRAAVVADRRATGDSYQTLARRHRVSRGAAWDWCTQAGLGYPTDEGGPGVN